jgi:hypothetical protein
MSVERRAATVQALCTELATELSAATAAAVDPEDHFVGALQQRVAAVRAAVRGAQSPLIKVVGAGGPLAAVVNGFFAVATVANGGKVKPASAGEPLVYRMLGPTPAVGAEPTFLYYADTRECWVLGACHSRPPTYDWGLSPRACVCCVADLLSGSPSGCQEVFGLSLSGVFRQVVFVAKCAYRQCGVHRQGVSDYVCIHQVCLIL